MVKETEKKNSTRKVYALMVGCLQLNYKGHHYVPEQWQPLCCAEVKVGVIVEIVATGPGRIYTRVAGSLTGHESNVWRRVY